MYACQNMALEILVVDPSQDWFVLDVSQLDDEQLVDTGDDILTPEPLPTLTEGDTFVLDESTLNSTEDLLEGMGATPAGYVWWDLTSTTMYIDIKRGVDKSRSIVARPYAGTLEARVIDPYLDALSNVYLGLNTPVRLRVEDDLVFLGTATSMRTEYDATGVPTLSLTATDAIAGLNSLTMAARPDESYESRIVAIAQAADIDWVIDDTAGEELKQTQDETNALELLYATQDSEGGLVWVDRWNTLHALPRGHEDLNTYSMADPVISRTNLVANSGMEYGMSDAWETFVSGFTLSQINTDSVSGTQCVRLTRGLVTSGTLLLRSAFNKGGPVVEGESYVLSAYVKNANVDKTPGTFSLEITWYNSSNTAISTSSESFASPPSTWTRYEADFVAPAGAVLAQVGVRWASAPTLASVYIDNVMLEQGTVAGDYFDGDTAASGDYTYSWSGLGGTYSFQNYQDPTPVATPIAPKYLFSNDHSVADHYCMTAFATGMDTEQVINQIEFNNLEWNSTDSRFEQNTYTYSDNSSANYYGVRKTTVRTTLDPADLSDYATFIFDQWSTAQRQIKSIATPTDEFKDFSVKDVVYIDIGDVVEVYLNDPANTMLNNLSEKRRVAEIYHRITPNLWETQIGLL